MKPFNEHFKKQVKDAFDSFNVDHLADEGWNAFKKKRKGKKLLPFLSTTWAKAATIAILITIGGFFTYRMVYFNDEPTHTAIVPLETEDQYFSIKDTEEAPEVIFAESGEEETEEHPPTPMESIETTESMVKADTQKPEIADTIKTTLPDSDETSKPLRLISERETLIALNDDQRFTRRMFPDEDDSEISTMTTKEYLPPGQTELTPPEKHTARGKTKMGAQLSGMMARVENMISTAPAVSIGFYTEYRLTDRLSARPSITLAKHSYGLESTSDEMIYSSYWSDQMATAIEHASTYEDASTHKMVVQETHMDIVAMEIPINLVFNVFERKDRSIYISAGTSTMIYLNQQFTGTYMDTDRNYAVNLDQKYSAFDRIDYFGLANFSAGYTFSLRKESKLTAEPFIQLPISKLTSNNVRIGFGGISVRYQFKH